MTPTVLFVTELSPCPPYGGELIHTYNLISSLSQHFNVVVLANQVAPDCELLPKLARTLEGEPAWYNLPRYNTALWAKLYNFRAVLKPRPSWVRCLEEIIAEHQPQVAWFNYGHWGQYAPIVQRLGVRTIMGTQNIQSILTRQRADNTPFGLLYLFTRLRAWAEKRHEEQFFKHFDRIVSVSEADRRYHAQFVGHERSILIPNYINEAHFQPLRPPNGGERETRAEHVLIMTGSFSNFQNTQAILWFLREVWPLIRAQHPQTKLQLVGKGAKELPVPVCQTASVECIGLVPTVTPYLRRATLAIVPLLHGSGTRIKILEAWACQTPLVSTTLGAEGLDLDDKACDESIILADKPATFAQAIITLLHDAPKRAQMAQNGLKRLQEHTSQVNTERVKRLVMATLSKSVPNPRFIGVCPV